jgi:hypothetical protein
MSLAELRKELKDLRKKAMPTPVSRMKKTECVAELERLKGIHSKEVKDVKEVVEKAEVPKKVAKKVESIQKKAHEKGEESVKKTKGVKASAPEVNVPTTKDAPKPKKESKAGSEEMKARMAKLREMRKKKE